MKVLDFGLAKLAQPDIAAAGPPRSASFSPTITSPVNVTGVGMLLGTAAYMSPEQAKGRESDKRSDIWAFGCVLYELLTGTRAFDGDGIADTLAMVLRGTPSWPALIPVAPSPVVLLVQACLARDPHDRPADVSAALFVLRHHAKLGGVAVSNVATIGAAPAKPRQALRLGAMELAVVVAAAATLLWARTASPSRDVTRFEIAAPAGTAFAGAEGLPRVARSSPGSRSRRK